MIVEAFKIILIYPEQLPDDLPQGAFLLPGNLNLERYVLPTSALSRPFIHSPGTEKGLAIFGIVREATTPREEFFNFLFSLRTQ